MPARLRDGLHFCICSGRAIFLDIPGDRYFLLPGRADEAFQKMAAGEILGPQDELDLRLLYSRGILLARENENDLNAGRPITPVARELGQDHHRRVLRDCARAIVAQYSARRLIRRRSLAEIVGLLASADAAPASSSQVSSSTVMRVASAFIKTRMVVRTKDLCLAQSIAFQRMCNNYQLSPTLVIGVSLNPFSAHCWVQQGDCVLNDSLEHVRQFTPIFAA